MKKKILTLLLAACVGTVLFTACGNSGTSSSTQSGSSSSGAVEVSDELNSKTEITGDKEILVVSFGTSYNDTRSQTICAIENAIADAYPDYSVQRAFTAQTIIDKLAKRDGLVIDNVEQALDRAKKAGVKTMIVQPTHLMDGNEYHDLSDTLDQYAEDFTNLVLGDPLLTTDADYEAVAAAITASTKAKDDGSTAICFMGHGTDAESNQDYVKLQGVLTDGGFGNYYIGTVEATPTVDDLLAAIDEKGNYKKVVLQPLMVVAGDHANNDMAGDEEDSWKSIFEKAGYEVEPVLQGLGGNSAIQDIYLQHVQASVDSIR